jgi:hypothetical protein
LGAKLGFPLHVWDAAYQHQRGGATGGKDTDAIRIDAIMFGPGGEHVVEQAAYFPWPIDRSLNKPAFVPVVVARMCQRRHHESRLRQGKRRIIMGKVCTSTAVRDDNERQSFAFDDSVGRHLLSERTGRLRRWRRVARIPDSHLE